MERSLFQEPRSSADLTSGTHTYSWPSRKSEFERKRNVTPTLDTGAPSHHMQSCKNGETSSSDHGLNPFIEYMKLNSLPEVSPFYGRDKENFKRFVSAFSVKYPSTMWDDRSRAQLFESFLRRDALTLYETLPRSVREGTFEGIVQAMKERLKVDSNGECVKAMTQLSTLTMREGQTIAEFCLVLERLFIIVGHTRTHPRKMCRCKKQSSCLDN